MTETLELGWATPRAWAEAALAEPLALLSDHAYCELGAAAAAQGLIARRPGDAELVERLGAHASDELRHFRQVHRLLVELGGRLAPVRRNPYAEGLLAGVARGDEGLLDRLLVFGWIERRSLERFELLAAVARERASPLADLYAELGPSEAGHAALFLGLARARCDGARLARRLEHWRAREAELVCALPGGPRIHSGPPGREGAA
ncbi:MAG TPA: tRNA isopentenyl-2-thiomethyl-A-37 hydroxylase MiaE [Planctomycetota bacterium]